jgi:hypothetical protein
MSLRSILCSATMSLTNLNPATSLKFGEPMPDLRAMILNDLRLGSDPGLQHPRQHESFRRAALDKQGNFSFLGRIGKKIKQFLVGP